MLLPVSWEARFGHRTSDYVVASAVWGWVGGCSIFVCLLVRRAVACGVGRSFRASRLGLHRCFQGLGMGGWVLKFVWFLGALFGCLRRGRLVKSVASRTAPLGLTFKRLIVFVVLLLLLSLHCFASLCFALLLICFALLC